MERVKVGQVYMDNDKRLHGARTLQVTLVYLVAMPDSKKGNYGCAAEFAECDVYLNGEATGKTTTIHTARMMKPTSNGYKLLNVHVLPRLQHELKVADRLANTVSTMLEQPTAQIQYSIQDVNRTLIEYGKTRESVFA